jgi:hypothetical protein
VLPHGAAVPLPNCAYPGHMAAENCQVGESCPLIRAYQVCTHPQGSEHGSPGITALSLWCSSTHTATLPSTLTPCPKPLSWPPLLQVLHTLSMAENNRVSDRRNILHVSSSRRQQLSPAATAMPPAGSSTAAPIAEHDYLRQHRQTAVHLML